MFEERLGLWRKKKENNYCITSETCENPILSPFSTLLQPLRTPFSTQTMARAGAFVWAFLSVVLLAFNTSHGDALGVNWGTQASHILQPSIVVRLLKDNGINKVKLFDADSWTVNALAGSGIEVMVGIPNKDLQRYNSYKKAKHWVEKNVTKHLYDGGVDIR